MWIYGILISAVIDHKWAWVDIFVGSMVERIKATCESVQSQVKFLMLSPPSSSTGYMWAEIIHLHWIIRYSRSTMNYLLFEPWLQSSVNTFVLHWASHKKHFLISYWVHAIINLVLWLDQSVPSIGCITLDSSELVPRLLFYSYLWALPH